MRRGLVISAWSLAAVALLTSMLVGGIWVAGNTAAGRALIERMTYRLTAGHVALSGLAGAFPARLTLEELQLSDARGVWLRADHLELRWSPLALLERRIHVDDLQVARLRMERAPVAGKGGGGTSFPHIEVGRFAADRVELGEALVGAPATLSLRGNLQLSSLEQASGDIEARRLDGMGDYAVHLKADPRRIDATLAVHEPKSGPLENLLSLPGLGALSATLTVAGPRKGERVEMVLDAGELHGRAHGTVDLVQGSADLECSLEAAAMTPRPEIAWSGIHMQGHWRGSLSAPDAAGRLGIQGLRVGAGTRVANLKAELTAAGGVLAVHALVEGLEIPGSQPRLLADTPLTLEGAMHLDEPGRPLEFNAAHRLFRLRGRTETEAIRADGQRATLELSLPELAPLAAFGGQDVAGSARIEAQLTHGAAADAATLKASVAFTGGHATWLDMVGPRMALDMSGMLTEKSIEIRSMHVTGGGMTLSASGSAARAAQGSTASFIQEVQARWQLELPDLARLATNVAGDVTASGQLRGSPASLAADVQAVSHLSVNGSPSGMVEAALHARGLPGAPTGTIQAHGLLDGAPLNVDAEVERDNDVLNFKVRQADWKSARIAGEVSANKDLTESHGELRLELAQLGDLDRLLGASLVGSLQGSLGLVPAHGRTAVRIQLDGTNLIAGPLAGDLHLQANGVLEDLGVQLSGRLPKFYGGAATLAAAATLDVPARELRIASASFAARGTTARLLSPAKLSFNDGLSIDQLKIGAQDAVLDLHGRISPALDLSASLLHVKPALVNVFAPGLLAGGNLAAKLKLQGSLASPTGSVALDAGAIRFADESAAGLPPAEVHAEAQLADNTAALRATLSAGSGSQVTATGSAPLNDHGVLNMKLGGKLDVGLANALLEARGLHVSGGLTLDAAVTGSGAAPLVSGGITLADGTLRDYAHGVNLSDIKAEIAGNEGGLQIKSFTARAASGSLGMTGSFGVFQHGMPIDVKISAKNAQPVASNIVTANLDADLRVSGTLLERIDVAGTIHVIRAVIGIPNSLPPDVAVLDVRRRGEPAQPPGAKQLVVGWDVAIKAPQQILVQGRGLDAEMGGEIKLSGTTDELAVSGGFDLQRGSFTLAGNKLNLSTPGRVSFDGAGLRKKIDPTLDFTATTVVTDNTVTLRISGFADAPRFDFTSSPPLPQDEIMARLLFGESAASLTALQAAEIAAALATLTGAGGSGSNPLVKLQKSLGLDRLSVGSNTTTTATGATQNSGATIAAGRYVSKRVYVEGKQTTTGASQVEVDVDLTKHVKLQTRLGNGSATAQGTTPENDPGSSVGLSYQFEY